MFNDEEKPLFMNGRTFSKKLFGIKVSIIKVKHVTNDIFDQLPKSFFKEK